VKLVRNSFSGFHLFYIFCSLTKGKIAVVFRNHTMKVHRARFFAVLTLSLYLDAISTVLCMGLCALQVQSEREYSAA
jgi:hypothetical protein